MEDKPHLLVRAMQACGALFVKTERANNFISETLASARDPLIQEFVSCCVLVFAIDSHVVILRLDQDYI